VLAAELIRSKRDGGELSAEEIRFLVSGITDGSVSDAQVGALAMAIVWRGMSKDERVALTGAMRDSGDVLEWDGDRILDKHSTGGVGDKVSLLLAPIVAACGGQVPMISGRGLGHTGGTLDKLQSIPGYDVAPGNAKLRAAVASAGCAIIGQTGDLAPADRRLYAIRDATGTVESIPLIVASILSKKLAAGLSALVMDVKVGSGAFLPDRSSAQELARAIVEVAQGNGLPTSAHPEGTWWTFFNDPQHPELNNTHKIDFFADNTDPRYVFIPNFNAGFFLTASTPSSANCTT